MKNLLFFVVLFAATSLSNNAFSQTKQKKSGKEQTTYVSISTKYGDLTIKLYNETPLHRDNFIKLVNEKYLDSTLFHRVIKQFMIQGGDPDSKKASPGSMLGNGGPAYTIPAELRDTLFHKKGALAAARQGDDVNPKKESSGSQFYLVQGKVYTTQELDAIENQMNNKRKQQIFSQIFTAPENQQLNNRLNKYQQEGKSDSIQALIRSIQPEVNKEFAKTPPFKFQKKQRDTYTTIGGTPFLDGAYTVFGEVISGLDVIDKIAALPVDANNRPVEDVRMIVKIIKK